MECIDKEELPLSSLGGVVQGHDSDPHLPNETHTGREFVHGVVATLGVHPHLLCRAPGHQAA